jgi:hypothetical protein
VADDEVLRRQILRARREGAPQLELAQADRDHILV